MEAQTTISRETQTPATKLEEFYNQEELLQSNNEELDRLNALKKNGFIKNRWGLRLKSFFMFGCFAFLFNIAFAFMLGELLGKTWYGFFILAIIYFVIGIVLYVGYMINKSKLRQLAR